MWTAWIFFTGSLHKPHCSHTLLQSELPAQKALLTTITLGNTGAHNLISPTVDKMYVVWTFIKMGIMTSLSHLTIDSEQAAIQTEVPSFSTLTIGAWDQLPQRGVKKNLILRILKLCWLDRTTWDTTKHKDIRLFTDFKAAYESHKK